jgi:hypothetical protein
MPAVSISTIYFLRKIFSHDVFHPDPVLVCPLFIFRICLCSLSTSRNVEKDFVLAIVPVGPPAITLAAVSNIDSNLAGL